MDKQLFTALTQSIAQKLGGAWEQPHDDNPAYVRVTLAGGEVLGLCCNAWAAKGRISVSAIYPYHLEKDGNSRATVRRDFDRSISYGDDGSISITVAETKSADQIVKDIERRFLPEFRRLHAMAVAWVAEQSAYADTSKDTERRARAAVLGLDSLYVEQVGGSMVYLRCHGLDIETVEAICGLLKARQASRA